MPNKEIKSESVETAKKIFADNSAVIVLDYKGLNAKNVYSLRKTLKSKDANIKVLKNTLVKLAIGETQPDLVGEFKDQVAISYSNDAVSLSNILVNFAKENEQVKIKNGYMDGKLLTTETINSLSALGSIEEVRAKFVGLLTAPANQLARVLKAQEEKLSA